MQVQPYHPQNLAAAAPDRIPVPAQGLAPATPQPATLVQVFGREVWKRKRLLAVWLLVTAVAAGVVVTTIARPVYRGEGRLSYRPLYGAGGPRPIYTPPNIQSAVQILKTDDVFEPVRAKHTPHLTAIEFARNVNIDLSKQSEFIDVSYDDPSPAVAAAVTNDLMAEGMKYFADVRGKSIEQSIIQVRTDLARATNELEAAKKAYADEFKARKIADPDFETDHLKTALSSIGSQLRQARQQRASLSAELAYQKKKRDNPDKDDQTIDDQFVQDLNIRLSAINNRMMDEQAIQTARAEVERLRPHVAVLRPLVIKGTYPRAEYDLEVSKLRAAEGVLKAAEETREERDLVKKALAEFQTKTRGGKRPAQAIVAEINRLEKELAVLPETIRVLEEDEREKKTALADLVVLTQELGPKKEEIGFLRNRAEELHAQLKGSDGRSLDPHANDLRVHSNAVTPLVAYSTNAPKLGLALVGVSALLFVGYLSLFALPKGTFTGPMAGGLAAGPTPGGGLAPRTLVALVPYSQQPRADQAVLNANAGDGMPAPSPVPASTEAADPMTATPTAVAPTLPPLADPAGDAAPVAVAEPEPVRALAERIVEEGVDRGGVVLFSPTNPELRLTPAIGDLGQFFSSRGDRVLVFDTRQSAEMPTWVQANGVAETVAGYLNGSADGPTGCFVPTELRGVEYSRVDLNSQISGVLEVHRFRQLLEQMRERYSVVFLVGPPVTLEADHPLLATMAEGMVLVTETAANPVEVHAYLDTLCQQVPARLYGTLAVPKTAA